MQLIQGIKHIFVVQHFKLFFQCCSVFHEGICLGVADYGSSSDTPSVIDRGAELWHANQELRHLTQLDIVGLGSDQIFIFSCLPNFWSPHSCHAAGHIFQQSESSFSNRATNVARTTGSRDVNYVRPSPMLHNPASFHHSLDLVWMHPCTEQIGAVSVSRRVVPAATLYLFIWVPVTE